MIKMPGELGKLKITVIGSCSVTFVFGLVILIISAIMKSKLSSIEDETKTVLNTLKDGDFDLESQAEKVSNLFIAVGVFSLLASLVGLVLWLFSAYHQNYQIKVLIIAIAVVVFVFVFVSLVMKIVGFSLLVKHKHKIEGELKTQLIESLQKNFVSDSVSGGNDVSNGWNRMFMSLDCCAVNPVVSTTNDFDKTPWCTTKGECQLTNAEIPKACCVGVTGTNYTSAPSYCYSKLRSGTYKKKGCFQALRDLLKEIFTSKTSSVLGVGITLLVVEVFAVIISVLQLYRESR